MAYDKELRELIKKHAHYGHGGIGEQRCTSFDIQELEMFLRDSSDLLRRVEMEAYDKGWEDCEKREPVPQVDAIEFRQEQYGWNDSKMAAMLDMSKSHYSEFKHGKRGLPIGSIRKAYAIGVPASVLLNDELKALKGEDDGSIH